MIHTRRSGLNFPQWAASTDRQGIFNLLAEMLLSAADTCTKRSNVNGLKDTSIPRNGCSYTNKSLKDKPTKMADR